MNYTICFVDLDLLLSFAFVVVDLDLLLSFAVVVVDLDLLLSFAVVVVDSEQSFDDEGLKTSVNLGTSFPKSILNL